MRDAASVITHAVKGITEELASDYEVSLPRMYEILSTDCPYPKAKKLIRKIGKHNPAGAALIKADLDSMFSDILGDELELYTAADLHREAFEAVQTCLEHKCKADRLKELRELIATATAMINEMDREDETFNVWSFAQDRVAARRAK